MAKIIFKSNSEFFKKLFLKIVLISLTSCSSYQSKFDCNPASGIGCTGMVKSYALIKSGEAERLKIDQKKQKKCRLCK